MNNFTPEEKFQEVLNIISKIIRFYCSGNKIFLKMTLYSYRSALKETITRLENITLNGDYYLNLNKTNKDLLIIYSQIIKNNKFSIFQFNNNNNNNERLNVRKIKYFERPCYNTKPIIVIDKETELNKDEEIVLNRFNIYLKDTLIKLMEEYGFSFQEYKEVESKRYATYFTTKADRSSDITIKNYNFVIVYKKNNNINEPEITLQNYDTSLLEGKKNIFIPENYPNDEETYLLY